MVTLLAQLLVWQANLKPSGFQRSVVLVAYWHICIYLFFLSERAFVWWFLGRWVLYKKTRPYNAMYLVYNRMVVVKLLFRVVFLGQQ